MIKNIIFDLGRVVIHYDQEEVINQFAKTDEERKYLLEDIFKSPEWSLSDLGLITIEEAINVINNRHNNKFAKLTNDFWNNRFKFLDVNNEVVEIAKKLKEKKFNIYVLSNMSKEVFNSFRSNPFFDLCDGVLISAYEHLKKPDERFFNILLERYNLNPKECLLIDDDDTNLTLETANKLGILGRRVKPNDSNDIKRLLEEFNIL